MKYVSIIVAAIVLGGCVLPYPHYNWTTPIFKGSVTRADTGEPIAGAKVFIEGNPDIFVLSDENGLYEFGPTKEFEAFAVILPTAHPIPRVFNLTAVSDHGSQSVSTGSCIGDPGFECNGKEKTVNFLIVAN